MSSDPAAPVAGTPLSERLREAPAAFLTFPRSGSALFVEAAEAIERLYSVSERAVGRLIAAQEGDDWGAVGDTAAWIEERLNLEHEHA